MNTEHLSIPFFLTPMAAALMFLISLIAFHTWLIWLNPISMLSWKRLDYAWLSLTLLGVLSLGRINLDWLGKDSLVIYDTEVRASYYWYGKAIDQAATRYCQDPSSETLRAEFDSSVGPSIVGKLQQFCADLRGAKLWIDRLSIDPREMIMPRNFEQIVNARVASDLLRSEDAANSKNELVNEVAKAIKLASTAEQNRSAAEKAMKPSIPEILLKLLGPYLLAVGLALRVTRVTAEVKAEAEREA